MRLNAYILSSGLRPLWSFVDTGQNPADRPSRQGAQKIGEKGIVINKDHLKDGRKAERKALGSLRSLTVQPKTRQRYSDSLQQFYGYGARDGIDLAKKREAGQMVRDEHRQAPFLPPFKTRILSSEVICPSLGG